MDAMTFFEKTGMSEAAADSYSRLGIFADKSMYISFLEDSDGFIENVIKMHGEQKAYRVFLNYFVDFAVFAYEKYKEQNISDEIYFDTFSDFAVWNKICVEETGICGLKEVYWLSIHIKLQIFKIGRLQYQPCFAEEDFSAEGISVKKGEKVYNLHIQRGGAFDRNTLNESLSRACVFFKTKSLLCHCESWLLSPTLNKLLPPTSNILDFQRRFTIYFIDEKSDQGNRYCYNVNTDESKLTAFQRSVRELIRSGGNIGCASGYFIYFG